MADNRDNIQTMVITDKDNYLVRVGCPGSISKDARQYAREGFTIRTMSFKAFKELNLIWIYDKPTHNGLLQTMTYTPTRVAIPITRKPETPKKGIDIEELEKRFDAFFANETEETFNAWLKKKGYAKPDDLVPGVREEDNDDGFQPCDHCDLPDACAYFGCAIKNGVRKDYPIDGVL